MTKNYGQRFWQGFFSAIVALQAVLSLPLPSVRAETIIAPLSPKPELYGNLNQFQTTFAIDGCGPTSAINSFLYLQRQFPNLFSNHQLIPSQDFKNPSTEEMVSAANKLSEFMRTNENETPGTYIEDFIIGKMNYIKSTSGRNLKYEAQISINWRDTRYEKPDFVRDYRPPTLEFIAEQLQNGQDVEIYVDNGEKAHYLTLTSIEFNPEGDTGKIKFINPYDGKPGEANLTGQQKLGDRFFRTSDFELVDKDGNRTAMPYISHAVAESVPELHSLQFICVLTAAHCLILLRRSRHGKANNTNLLDAGSVA